MTSDRTEPALWLTWCGLIPPFVWWLGWFPGFLTSDSIDQLGQVARFEFFNFHPAFHTFTMWLVTRIWDNAGAVSLAQAVLLTGLLVLVARRLTDLGVNRWVAIGSMWGIAALPMVSITSITLWKDVPFTFAMIWAFTELLALARDRHLYWRTWQGPVQLGAALGLMWLYRHNGLLTVIPIAIALIIGFRSHRKGIARFAGALVGVAIVLPAILFPILDVEAEAIEPAQVFISDIAASLTHEPGNFTADELELLADVAPLDVWTDRYDCHDSTPLGFDPEFDASVITERSSEFRSLVINTVLTDLDTVAGHRWCAASYLFVPAQPGDSFFHRPPFSIPENDLGIVRDPISDRAFSVTFEVYKAIEGNGILWLTWRPALAIWLGLITLIAIGVRRNLRPLGWAAGLWLAHLVNVAVTTPAQEFRFAFGLYVVALAMVPLWWLVYRPSDATPALGVVNDGTADD